MIIKLIKLCRSVAKKKKVFTLHFLLLGYQRNSVFMCLLTVVLVFKNWVNRVGVEIRPRSDYIWALQVLNLVSLRSLWEQ